MSGLWRVGDEDVALGARAEGAVQDGFTITLDDRTISVTARVAPDGTYMITMPDGRPVVATVSRDPSNAGWRWITLGGKTWVVKEAELDGEGEGDAGGLEAPMPGKVLSVSVAPGDVVTAGATLLVVEAMKMEHAIKAPADGTVLDVHASPGDMVSPGTQLVSFEAAT